MYPKDIEGLCTQYKYETFPAEKAKSLWDRFEFIYTPKHGSWLNTAYFVHLCCKAQYKYGGNRAERINGTMFER